MAESEILGAVLIGGRSRRMGVDKARLVWRGETLVERAARTLTGFCGEVVAVGGSRSEISFPGLLVVSDRRPGLGPLGGLETAFEYATGRAVFVLACDLPRVSSELVAHLLAQAATCTAGLAAAWVPRSGDRVQPLCGLYRAGCAGALESYLGAGRRRAVEFLDTIDTTVVEIGPGSGIDRPDLLANINRPRDLERLSALDAAGTEEEPQGR